MDKKNVLCFYIRSMMRLHNGPLAILKHYVLIDSTRMLISLWLVLQCTMKSDGETFRSSRFAIKLRYRFSILDCHPIGPHDEKDAIPLSTLVQESSAQRKLAPAIEGKSFSDCRACTFSKAIVNIFHSSYSTEISTV